MSRKTAWLATLCVVMTTARLVTAVMDAETAAAIERLENVMGTMSRQLMMQQFYVEEQTRSNGNSGIKQARISQSGTRNYFSTSHVGTSIAAIHDHANEVRTVGMGEFQAVLNGVEFRTRHNDYRLNQKSTNNNVYGETEEIPFPDVPASVLNKATVDEQAAEMKEYFKAWSDQNDTHRDYKPHFKPVLCYLEGMWTHSDQEDIEEPFSSDRHHLDAKSWLDLQEKVRFTAYSGSKDSLENFAFLPTTVFSIINGTTPVVVQWNFRILCHPLNRDLPTNRLKVIEDVKTRIAHDLTLEQHTNSRAARFQVNVHDKDIWVDKKVWHGLLDELMEQIPGNDNYMGQIIDDVMGNSVYPFDSSATEKLNVAYYHRSYRVQEAGAMGIKTRRRSFGDENMFVAQTTQPKVAGLPIEDCSVDPCVEYFQRWSYAIPLEIIYMTPLFKWNPHNLVYRGPKTEAEGKVIYEGPDGTKRDGSGSPDKAFNGTNSVIYYQTPHTFFEDENGVNPADTTQDYTHVLDPQGNVQRVRAAGTRIFIPNIPGLGTIRQRYPIMPVHGEGSALWKQVEAFQDMMLEPSRFPHMFAVEQPVTTPVAPPEAITTQAPQGSTTAPANQTIADIVGIPNTGQLHFQLGPSNALNGSHTHNFELSEDQADVYRSLGVVDLTTEVTNSHAHVLRVGIVLREDGYHQLAKKCDGVNYCGDGHPRHITLVNL